MHSGDLVRPRHYQHFADLVNSELGAVCKYRPAGIRLPEYEKPLNRFSGFPFATLPPNVEYMIGINFDHRISNEAVLGYYYPTVGAMTVWNPQDHSVLTGPTVGFRLNQFYHPLYVDVRTGVLINPAVPERNLDLSIPLSLNAGIRGEGFQAGVNYTPILNVLGSSGFTHLVGVNFQMNLPEWF